MNTASAHRARVDEGEQSLEQVLLRRACNERHEAATLETGHDRGAVLLSDQLEFLAVFRSDWDNHAAALAQLGKKRGRNRVRGGRHDDAIVRSVLGQTSRTVAHEYGHIPVAEPDKDGGSGISQGPVALNRVDSRRQFRKQSSLITGSRSNFQYNVFRFNRQIFEHERDYVRLRNGLLFADGKGVVLVGL